MTKSRAAFLLTVDGLFRAGRVYFWTFTFREVHPDWVCSKLFRDFLKELRRCITDQGSWGGVRVCELHKEHGVHYHALFTARVAVDVVRTVGKRFGIGRIHVCKAQPHVAQYLGKYLSKQHDGPRTESGRQARRWAAFGDIERTRVSDLQNDSPMWVYRREHRLPFLDYQAERVLAHCWIRGPEVFRSAWFAFRSGRTQDAFDLAAGKLEVRYPGILYQPPRHALKQLAPGGIPF